MGSPTAPFDVTLDKVTHILKAYILQRSIVRPYVNGYTLIENHI